MKISTQDRFMRHVDRRGDGECWNWTGSISGGYGMFVLDGRKKSRKQTTAHRCCYLLFVGPLLEDEDVHHKCENKSCVNWGHLQKVSVEEHVNDLTPNCITFINKRKTHCIRGHEFNAKNTRVRVRNGRLARECRPCSSSNSLSRYHAKKRKK
jgi:hypothetical protein